jgi:hypothetical protein
VVDEERKCSITMSNDLAKEAMTVDVTPRRRQKFKLQPGTECKWTTSNGTSGTVSADKWRRVTVPGLAIKAGK